MQNIIKHSESRKHKMLFNVELSHWITHDTFILFRFKWIFKLKIIACNSLFCSCSDLHNTFSLLLHPPVRSRCKWLNLQTHCNLIQKRTYVWIWRKSHTCLFLKTLKVHIRFFIFCRTILKLMIRVDTGVRLQIVTRDSVYRAI